MYSSATSDRLGRKEIFSVQPTLGEPVAAKVNLRDVLRAEAGRWKNSISIADVISQTHALQRAGKLWTTTCPFHAEKTSSFTVYRDHYHCFGCGAHGDVFDWLTRVHHLAFREAVAALAGAAGGSPVPATPQAPAFFDGRTRSVGDATRRRELARRIWCDAIDPRGTPIEPYLHRRGVCLPAAPVIRFHPRCPRSGGPLPAMVALMTDPMTGEPCGIHRTFLHGDAARKVAVAKPKMMLGSAGVVRLAEHLGQGLGLAEGIETALSCIQVIEWGPVWAATSAGAIRAFPVLQATTLNIFADADSAGLAAARACAARWNAAGAEALIHIPPEREDWNDAARRLGA